jgi:uncharacterized membrane protein
MNGAHLHLLLNHVPIFSTLFGIGIIIWGMFKKSIQVYKLGTVLLILGSVMSFFVLESGELAEEQIEEFSISANHQTIHEHEEAAEVAFWFSIVMGGFAIVSLISTNMNTRFQTTLNGVVLITGILTLLMLIYASYEGGKIRHNQELGESSDMFHQESNLSFNPVSEYSVRPPES